MGMQYGFLSEFVLKEHALVSVAMVLICGLGSLRFWIIWKISGRSNNVVSVIKTVMYESGYFAYIVGNTRPVRPCIRDFFLKNSIGYLLFSDQKNKYNDLCIKD